MKLLWTCLVVTACGGEAQVDPSLRPLLDHYLALSQGAGELDKLASLSFGNILEAGERGVCRIEKSKIRGKPYAETRTIVIDPRGEWGNPLAMTIYHELGHCLSNLPHTRGEHDIMNPMRAGGPDYWTPDHIEDALTAMLRETP